MWLFYVIVAVVFFATFAMCIDKGLWSNTLTVFNVLLSGVIAFGGYAPMAKLVVDNGGESYTFLFDFLFLWTLYVLAFILLHRVGAAMLSKTRMRFKHPIDSIGGPVMAAVAGWLMAGIVGASLHASPFDRDAFGGVFTKGRSAIMNPDIAWLNLMNNVLAAGNLGVSSPEFDRDKYISDFAKQREALEKQETLRVK